MTEEERKEKERIIALKEYDTVKGGRPALTFEQFLKENYGEEAAQQKDANRKMTDVERQEYLGNESALYGDEKTEQLRRSPDEEVYVELPLTEEQNRFYRRNYDEVIDQVLNAVKDSDEYQFMSYNQKSLALYDAMKKAEEALRRQAQAM